MQKRKPRVVEWNSCVDVPLSRGVLGNYKLSNCPNSKFNSIINLVVVVVVV